MIVFFCIYSIRSLKDKSVYGNEQYNDGIENYEGNQTEHVRFHDQSSEFEKSMEMSDQNNKTFEKVF
jgi:hypothetical protein